ncbi:MAG: polysaccharide biosynthesis/export family protein [Gammaproteobacteria bacterium]|nr:polysaccharide biosynthesis/export family protein [Gammaproteobacteria bacterium]
MWPPPAAIADVSSCGDEYRIGVGDQLNVRVWRNEDLSVVVPVRPDGKISVPLAGDVAVGDQTPEQVSAIIVERLSTYIRDPYVTIIVSNMAADSYRCRVRVTGAIVNPLSIPHREGMTVLDVILEAGGTNEFANPAKTILFRGNGERLKVNLQRILRKGDMSTNYALAPGDIVTIPERIF